MNARRSCDAPASSGVCTSAPNTRSSNCSRLRIADDAARCRAVRRAPAARRSSAGSSESATRNCARARRASIRFACTRCSSVIASAAAVASSSSDALATSIPVRSRHHRLEVEERFEPALRDLRLVRRVRRVPARVLEHVAQDDARRDAVVVAEADVGRNSWLRAADCAEVLRNSMLRLAGRQVERPFEADAGGIASSMSASSEARRRPSASRAASAGIGSDVAGLKTSGRKCSFHEVCVLRGVEQRAGLCRHPPA